MIQVMGFRIHIVVYGKKRGGDEYPAAQFFIYYNLSLRFEVVENNRSVKMLRKVLRGERGGKHLPEHKACEIFYTSHAFCNTEFRDVSSHSFKRR